MASSGESHWLADIIGTTARAWIDRSASPTRVHEEKENYRRRFAREDAREGEKCEDTDGEKGRLSDPRIR